MPHGYVRSRDEAVFEWTTEKRDLTIKAAEEAIRSSDRNSDAISFAIVDSSNMRLVGNIAMAFRAGNKTSAEIMYWLAPWGRGRGIATNSVKLLCHWAFENLKLQQVTLKTRPKNIRSQMVAERAGFKRLESENKNHSDIDHVWFELTTASDAKER